MKKYLLFLTFLFLPFSVFAWADTDRICADDTKQWKIIEKINVFYPWENPGVHKNIWKDYYTLERYNTYNPKGWDRLYYIIFRAKGAELYSYDCDLRKPKLLLEIPINTDWENYYAIDYINDGNIILAWKEAWASEWTTQTIIAYNIYSNKKLFTVKRSNWVFWEGAVDWFVNSKNYWYLYFSSIDFYWVWTLYRIDKKTKKITKL